MELWRIVTEQQRLITEMQAALESKGGAKDAKKSTHEVEANVPSIEFVSADSPIVPRSMWIHCLPRGGLYSKYLEAPIPYTNLS